MNTTEWRRTHPRCRFCQNVRVTVRSTHHALDTFWCRAKVKLVRPDLPRHFCPLFRAAEGEDEHG